MRRTDCRYDPRAKCPWDGLTTTRLVVPGIWWVSTPGHAGFQVSQDRYNAMPQKYRETSFTGNQWFEEDCSWCGVVLAFPEVVEHNANVLEKARQAFENFYGGNQ